MGAKLNVNQLVGNGWRVPIEILLQLFYENRLALLPLYLFATRHKDFAGHLPVSKIPQIAKLIDRTPGSVQRKLTQLETLGLCERQGKVWLFTGGNLFTARSGKTKVKTVAVERLDRPYLTTLTYATLISEQVRRKARKKKQPSVKRDGLKKEVSCSFTSAWVGRSVPTISKQRKKAKWLGLLEYERQFETVLKGGENVRQAFSHAHHTGNTKASEMLFQSGEMFTWVNEKPAVFTGILDFSVHSVPLRLKAIARNAYKSR